MYKLPLAGRFKPSAIAASIFGSFQTAAGPPGAAMRASASDSIRPKRPSRGGLPSRWPSFRVDAVFPEHTNNIVAVVFVRLWIVTW